MKSKYNLIIILCFLLSFLQGINATYAQNVGININGTDPNPSAILDINASPNNDKGILIPRVQLTATNNGAPISPAPGIAETGLMVFNKAAAGTSPNDVVKGFYYWNGTEWSAIGGGTSSGGGAGGWTDDGTVVRLTASTDFVGIGTASPAATSALDITSTTKGLLIPRMTTSQRNAITSPATGLQIYNTDCSMLNYWSGTCWISTSKALPDPGIITSSGTTVFCAGQVRTYSISAITGATSYIWSVPPGTSITSGNGTVSISATFGNISGDVCVKASNACETSNNTCMAVSVDPIPNTPGNITGPSSINPGQQSVNYFIASVNGASAYTWAYSGTGLTISSGIGTTSIVVNFACNATAGNLTVTANSTCGASTASSLAVTITTSITASAGAAKFGGATIGGSPTAAGGNATYTYSWSPSSNLSSATVANPTALCTGSTTTYTVTATDGYSCSASSTVVVTRNLTASAGANQANGACPTTITIGGSPTAAGSSGSYTYSWSPGTGLSSTTIANPTTTATSNTTYTVTVTDGNSCSATSSMTFTAGGGNTVTFNNTSTGTTGTKQTWTVPSGVTCIVIEAWGAQGGGGSGNSMSAGGKGAQMKGSFTVTPGEIIDILVGHAGGSNGGAHGNENGGGGGTFVVKKTNNVPLVVAGGGGGSPSVNYSYGCTNNIANADGKTTTSGTTVSCYGTGAGGTSGSGGGIGSGYYTGGSGGGFSGSGTNSTGHCAPAYGGTSYLSGGAGGTGNTCYTSDNFGGYGGGGGGQLGGPGAGGGYSGGGSASEWSSYGTYGGGGGSYNNGTNQSNTAGSKTGHGQVKITY